VGCGVGNTSLPVSAVNPSSYVYSCDYAATAVQLLRDNDGFDAARMHAFVADITRDDLLPNVPADSIDVVTCIFVLSANSWELLPQVRCRATVTLPTVSHCIWTLFRIGSAAQYQKRCRGSFTGKQEVLLRDTLNLYLCDTGSVLVCRTCRPSVLLLIAAIQEVLPMPNLLPVCLRAHCCRFRQWPLTHHQKNTAIRAQVQNIFLTQTSRMHAQPCWPCLRHTD
jgi:hypothetical protein